MVYTGIRLDRSFLDQDPMTSGLGSNTDTTSDNLDQGLQWIKGGKTLAGMAAGLSAIGSFFSQQLKNQTARAKAQGLEIGASEFEDTASDSTEEAHLVIEAGELNLAVLGMGASQKRSQQIADTARRGVIAAAGSSAEVRASMEIMRQIDARTIRLNTARRANQARMRSVDLRNRAMAARTSAKNLRQTSRGIEPFLVALSAGAQSGVGASLAMARGVK